MESTSQDQAPDIRSAKVSASALEIQALYAALERPAPVHGERRRDKRMPFRTEATLRLGRRDSDECGVLIRDATCQAMSFIVGRKLPLRADGTIEFRGPDGLVRKVPCWILRCRQFAVNWFEGVLILKEDVTCFPRNPNEVRPAQQPTWRRVIHAVFGRSGQAEEATPAMAEASKGG